MGIGIMDTEQLQLPALDLPKTEPFDVTSHIVEDLMSSPTFSWGATNSQWLSYWLPGDGELFSSVL